MSGAKVIIPQVEAVTVELCEAGFTLNQYDTGKGDQEIFVPWDYAKMFLEELTHAIEQNGGDDE